MLTSHVLVSSALQAWRLGDEVYLLPANSACAVNDYGCYGTSREENHPLYGPCYSYLGLYLILY